MASTKEIKRRIKSVKSTKKITKAMELVSASKMKRAISQTLASRLYASYSWELLTSLSGRVEETTNKFFIENNNEKSLIVLITSNRGLCGGYNSQVIKKTITKIKEGVSPRSDLGEFDYFSLILYLSKIASNINGTTIVASDSITYLGVSLVNLSQVIFSFGVAPEYEP